jgi:peroxiredoxin
MLILSQTPAYYYASDLINISADTVAALDLMHVAKCREHIASFGEGLEEVMSLAAAQAGVTADYTEATVRWADPQYLSPAVMADAATKLKSIGYPLDVIAEQLGETPQQVRRITASAASQALLAASLLPANPAPTAGNVPDEGATGG